MKSEKEKGKSGEILRVKHGYNPNSSSLGSIVFALPAALLGVTAGFGAVSGIIMAAFMKKADKDSVGQKPAPEKEEGNGDSAEPKGE